MPPRFKPPPTALLSKPGLLSPSMFHGLLIENHNCSHVTAGRYTRPGKPVSQPSQAAYDTSARLSGFTFVFTLHHHSGQQAAKKINHDHGRSSKEAVNSHHREIATRQLTIPSMEAAPTFLAPIQFIVHNHGHGTATFTSRSLASSFFP